jgi:hypothetical protein
MKPGRVIYSFLNVELLLMQIMQNFILCKTNSYDQDHPYHHLFCIVFTPA